MLFDRLGLRSLQKNLFAIFAGDDFSVPDPDAGPYKSKRSLPRIWSGRACAARGVKFDMCNTVNLDNEVTKLREHMANGLVVPTFGPAELGKEDDTLLDLKDYVTRLAKECHGDVREYMKLFPFRGGSSLMRALPPLSVFLDEVPEVDEVTKGLAKIDLGAKRSEKPETEAPQL